VTTVAELLAAHAWRAIPGCPGRFVLRGGPQPLEPAALVGEAPLRAFRVAAAPDQVLVAELPDGGLISYRRADGRCIHTLNTAEGFRRKLTQLGIEL